LLVFGETCRCYCIADQRYDAVDIGLSEGEALMTLGLLFWLLMVIWLIFGFAWNWGALPGAYGPWGHSLLLFILLLLLGWATFGAPLRG
jgi:hypothetical protein